MIIEPTDERKVIFENLKEVEAAWPIIEESEKIFELRDSTARQTLDDTTYDIESLLEDLGFKNARVYYDMGYHQGSGASFTADCFCNELNKNMDFNDLREKRGFSDLINVFEELYDEIGEHQIEAIYHFNNFRNNYVHCKTLNWEIIDTDIEYESDIHSIEYLLDVLECEVESILKKAYDEIMLDDQWVKEVIVEVGIEFILDEKEVEEIKEKLSKKKEI